MLPRLGEKPAVGRPRLAWGWLLLIAPVSGYVGVEALAWVGLSPDAFGLTWGQWSTLATASGLCIALLLLARFYGVQRSLMDALGFRKAPAGAYAWAVGALLVGVFLYPLVESGLALMGVPMTWWGGGELGFATGWVGVGLTVALSCLLFPVGEEILYRGYLQTALRDAGLSPVAAVLASALAFGVSHLFVGPGLSLYVFVWGLLPGWLFMRYNSLYPAVLLHLTNNVLAYLVFPWVLRVGA